MTHTEKRSNRKLIVLCLLLVLLLAATAFGTMAWLTASSSVTNTFTVGNFNEPKPNPENPGTDENPTPEPDPGSGVNPEDPEYAPNFSGYLYEPSWDTTAEHKLVPGGSLYKDPYVGIGKDSEDAVVYGKTKQYKPGRPPAAPCCGHAAGPDHGDEPAAPGRPAQGAGRRH